MISYVTGNFVGFPVTQNILQDFLVCFFMVNSYVRAAGGAMHESSPPLHGDGFLQGDADD